MKRSRNYFKLCLYCVVLILHTILNGEQTDYVDRWAFQKICDFSYDPYMANNHTFLRPSSPHGISLNPGDIKPGSTIFVRSVDKFFKEIHPLIRHPYIIVTHGTVSDMFRPRYIKYLSSPKIIKWFAVHCPLQRSLRQLVPIPLGICEDFHATKDKIKSISAELKAIPKEKLLYCNFDATHDLLCRDRKHITDLLRDQDFCTWASRKDFEVYLREMACHKFTICPRGFGPDSWRIYEALLVGSIPIITNSELDDLYSGMPVLLIKHWGCINRSFLENSYSLMSNQQLSTEKLYMQFWLNEINTAREDFFKPLKGIRNKG